MTWSLRIGSVAGIGIFLHWTFIILITALFLLLLAAGDARTAIGVVAFIAALFGCVLLHELGHALCAKRYGIGTRDITLLPIGGLARLERMPTEPAKEFWVAVAGPAVNVAIAGLLALLILALQGTGGLTDVSFLRGDEEFGGNLLGKLMWINVILVIFNMLPAFPMDGGRVLRAALATRLPYHRATRVAATVGQGMAIVFAFAAFLPGVSPLLLFIAIFVFLGAGAEAHYAETQFALKGLKVRDAMLTRFRALEENDTLGDAVDELLAGSQQDFPIVRDGDVVGLLTRQGLLQALSDHDRQAPVTVGMTREFECLGEDDDLETLQEKLRMGELTTLPVMGGNRLCGLLTRENLGEVIMIHSALAESGNGTRLSDILHKSREHASREKPPPFP